MDYRRQIPIELQVRDMGHEALGTGEGHGVCWATVSAGPWVPAAWPAPPTAAPAQGSHGCSPSVTKGNRTWGLRAALPANGSPCPVPQGRALPRGAATLVTALPRLPRCSCGPHGCTGLTHTLVVTHTLVISHTDVPIPCRACIEAIQVYLPECAHLQPSRVPCSVPVCGVAACCYAPGSVLLCTRQRSLA